MSLKKSNSDKLGKDLRKSILNFEFVSFTRHSHSQNNNEKRNFGAFLVLFTYFFFFFK